MPADYHDLLKDMKLHVLRFRLVPSLMNGFSNTAGLKWQQVRFRDYISFKMTPRRALFMQPCSGGGSHRAPRLVYSFNSLRKTRYSASETPGGVWWSTLGM